MSQDPGTTPAETGEPAFAVDPETALAAARLAFDQSPAFMAVVRGPEHVFQLVNPAYARLMCDRALLGRRVRDVFPELLPGGLGDRMDEVYRTGVPFTAHEWPVRLRGPDGGERLVYMSFVYHPARGPDGRVEGIIVHGLDVTETVHARQAAELLALEHEAILAHIRDAVVVTDLRGRVTYANAAADVLHGGSAWRQMHSTEYHTAYALQDEHGRPLLPEELPVARLMRGDPPPPDMLLRLCRPDGEERWVEADARKMVDAAGQPVAGLLMVRDVTERRRAAEATRHSERRYRELFESAPVGVAHVSPAMTWLDLNEPLQRMLGYTAAELVGTPVHDVTVAEDVDALRADAVRQMAGAGGTFQVEKRYRRKDGGILHAQLSVSLVRDARGQPDHYVGVVQDVGEQRAAQERLRESEERFRVLVEHAPVGMVSSDGEARIRHANRAFHTLLGYPDGALVGRLFTEISHPGERRANDVLFRRMLDGEIDHFTLEKRYLRRDGEPVWTRVFVGAVRDAEGAFLYTTTLVEDITEQRAADAALRESEERQRRIVETMSDALVIVSPRGIITFANPAAVRMLGGQVSVGTADLRSWAVERPGGTPLPWPERPVQSVISTGQPVQGAEVSVTTPDGTRAALSINAAPLLGAGGEVEGVVVSVRDVTDARRAAERIRYQATLLEAVGEAVIATDVEGRVAYWNPSAERLYGYTAAEAAGQPLAELIGRGDPEAPVDWEGTAARVIASAAAGTASAGEHLARRKDRTELPVRVTASPIYDGAGRVVGIVGVSGDLSERRALEHQLQQSQKMEAVGRLAGGIAHDFNNLLSVILGTIALLLLDVGEGDPLGDDLREIDAAARRAARLTQQLLAFSRKQVLKPVTLDLNERIRDMETMMRRVIGEDVEFVTELAPGVGRVRVDPSQLEQVLMNLLVNARDALPRGGRLTVRTRDEVVAGHDSRGEAEAVEAGTYACLCVSDTGTGMDADTLRRIFEPFFTTKEVGKGTGLGLSMVYGIVRQSGGFVQVDSEPGHGTEFRVYLPRVEQAADGDAALAGGLPLGTGTVLLVEDEDAVRSVARRILHRAGFTVLEAVDGPAALALGKAHAGAIDVIVTDVVMPGMSGSVLAEAFVRLHPETHVLFMSGYTDDRLVLHGVEGQAASFVQKPFRPGELVERVRGLIEG